MGLLDETLQVYSLMVMHQQALMVEHKRMLLLGSMPRLRVLFSFFPVITLSYQVIPSEKN
jgi:hypothetical protein